METLHDGHVGAGLKRRRLLARVRQTEIADAMGVSQPRVSIIENSVRVSLGVLLRYQAALADLEMVIYRNLLRKRA